jgi:pimeloyl-ACP methyl ester carboxylesterase
VRLAARHWPAPPGARASVVLVHGFSASGSEEKVVALAEALHAAGHGVIVHDARGHGASGGECTLGDCERLDVDAAVRAAQADGMPLVVVAASMGAIAALAYQHDMPGQVLGLVTVSCPAHWRLPLNGRGLASAVLTQTPLGRWLARRQMNVRIARRLRRPPPPVELVAGITVPVAIVHGRDDPFISTSAADDLHAAARDPRVKVIVEHMGHAYESESIEPVIAAVEWVLENRV